MREKLREGRPTFPSGNVAGFRSRKVAAMRPRSTAEPHVVRRRRWALHTNWTARPLFCAATNALLSANGRKVSAFTWGGLPERRFRGVGRGWHFGGSRLCTHVEGGGRRPQARLWEVIRRGSRIRLMSHEFCRHQAQRRTGRLAAE